MPAARRLSLLPLLLFAFVATVAAQVDGPSTNREPPPRTEATLEPRTPRVSPLDRLPPGPVELVPADGRLQPRRVDDDADDLPPDVPAVFVSRVDLSGRVRDGVAELTADIVVNLTTSGWQTVRLAMSEAIVVDSRHQSDARDAAAAPVVGPARSDELTWRLRGLGAHSLTLRLHVPVTAAAGGGQSLKLTMPPLPTGYRATLDLTIPVADAELRTGDSTAVRVVPVDEESSSTRLLADLPDPRLAIAWAAPVTADVSQISSVRTAIAVATDGPDLLTLEARQTIEATDAAALTRFDVLLPDGFELVDVGGADSLRNVRSRVSDASPGRVEISIAESGGTDVVLIWRLRRRLVEADLPARLTVSGFRIPDAASQTGTVSVVSGSAVQLRLEKSGLRGARLTAFEDGRGVLQIDTQPFAVPISVEPNRASFLAGPTMELRFDRDRVGLTADWTVDVLDGSVIEIPIAGVAEDWQPLESAVSRGSFFVAADDAVPLVDGRVVRRGDRFAFLLATPQTGRFRFAVRTSKPLRTGDDPTPIRLPVVEARQTRPPVIVVNADDSVEVELDAVGESRIRDIAANPADDARVQRYVAIGDSPELEATVTWHAPELSARTQLDLTRVDRTGPAAISLLQTLTIDVRYDRLDRFVLTVPESLLEIVPLGMVPSAVPLSVDGEPVPGERLSVLEPNELAVTLPSPQSTVAVQIGPYLDAIEPGRPVPVFRPVGVTLAETELVLRDSAAGSLELAGSDRSDEEDTGTRDWVRLPRPGSPVYLSNKPNATITVAASKQSGAARLLGVVPRSLVRTEVLPSGDIATDASFRFPATAPTAQPLAVLLPLDAEAIVGRFGEVDLTIQSQRAADSENEEPDAMQVVFAPVLATGETVFRVRYRQPGSELTGIDGMTIQPPRMDSSIHVERTDWELTLPAGRHLLMSPTAMSKSFRWQRSGLGWQRLATQDYQTDRVQAWGEPVLGRPSYAFTTPGSLPPLSVATIGRSWLVLLGAAVTLVFAFALMKVPVRRQLPLVLLIGFAVAAAAVHFLEPLQLLLQPALLGLGLSVLAVTIDGWNRQPDRGPVLTVPSESGFIQPAGLDEMLQPGDGSSLARTVIRQPRPVSSSPPIAP